MARRHHRAGLRYKGRAYFCSSAVSFMLRRIVGSRSFYLVLGLLLTGGVVAQWVRGMGGPEAVWDRYGLLAPMVSVPIHTLVAITPLPSDLMGITNGTVYGFWFGAALSWAGWFVASFVQYGIGRVFRRDFDVEGWMARSPKRLRRFPVGHPAYLIGARFVPYAGGHLATLIPGALGVGMARFAWCTALALVPSSLFMAGVGAGVLLL